MYYIYSLRSYISRRPIAPYMVRITLTHIILYMEPEEGKKRSEERKKFPFHLYIR
jgi:hypothetical protein